MRTEAEGTAGMTDGAAGAATKGPDGGKTEAVIGESAEMGWVEEVDGLAFVPCGEGEDAREESSAKKLAASSTAARARGEAGRSPCSWESSKEAERFGEGTKASDPEG
jgi:hypothetical protein